MNLTSDAQLVISLRQVYRCVRSRIPWRNVRWLPILLSALRLVAHSGSKACHLLSIPVLVKLSSVGEVFRSDDSKEILRPGSIISNESMLKSLDAKQSQMVASPSDRPPISSATLSAKGI